MQIKFIVFQALAVSLVASVPLGVEEKAVSQRSIELSVTTPVVLVTRQSKTDLENSPDPPPGIQDFFDRIRGKGKSGTARGTDGKDRLHSSLLPPSSYLVVRRQPRVIKMHYIRLLRPPVINFKQTAAKQSQIHVELVLTITTDLGDSFLCPKAPLDLDVFISESSSRQNWDGISQNNEPDRAQQFRKVPTPRPPRWTAGSRVLKTEFLLPAFSSVEALSGATLCVRPANRSLATDATADLLNTHGLVMPIYVELRPSEPAETVALRRLRFSAPGVDQLVTMRRPVAVEVEEELGESIARHVWDAGVCTTAMLSSICCSTTPGGKMSTLPKLRGILATDDGLAVIEIGCGVGILGIGLATALLHRQRCDSEQGAQTSIPRPVSILMTDLPEARDRAVANIARYSRMNSRGPSQREGEQDVPEEDRAVEALPISVDYEDLDWEDGRKGTFGPKVNARPWDLVMLSDCTYNVDMLPALVETLTALHRSVTVVSASVAGPKVLLATKPRHESEKALFGLMRDAGWSISDQAVMPLPVMGGEAETIEVYLFTRPADSGP
ncbi:hypothetical protein PpBr36_08740 [Pyricularia pennisetigena]|uniref:hypothetical protein n=1 Tax=Pyricularia pennisetigena TaxID=1578925 RepID=UPI00114E5F99|nr:hypothetical protein PpBr36_08740 [Pyricularia pennisetigena]TLS23941.1 hypothetical protein PpBr36_08740 [Pyricularia pennisetigena]